MKRKLRQSLAAVFACLAALSALAVSSVSTASAAATVTPAGYITQNQSLSQQYADAIETLAQGINNMEEEIDLYQYNIPIDLAPDLYEICVHTHPELFFLNDTYSYYQFTRGGAYYLYSFVPDYAFTAAEMAEKRESFYGMADWFLGFVDEGMSDFEKALILHDEIVLNSHYILTKDVYGIMVEGEGRCEGYARVYAYLLAQVGVKTEYVTSDSMNHAWVKVCVDGSYYNVDVTWDDPTVDRPGLVSHDFFLLSDEALQSTERGTDPHYGYTSDFTSPATYDNALFHEVNSKICFTDYGVYMIDNTYGSSYEKQLLTYDVAADTAQTQKALAYYWSAGSGSVWRGGFMGLAEQDNYLYYNAPDAIYAIDLTDGSEQLFAENTYAYEFYGLRVKDGVVYAAIAEGANSAREVVEIGPCLTREPELVLDRGDANGDGIVDIMDATAIQRDIADLEFLTTAQTEAGDMDGDGVLTVDDVSLLQMLIAGLAE